MKIKPALNRDDSDDIGSTHWEGCWEAHPKCALYRLRAMESALRDLIGLVERMPNRVAIESGAGGKIMETARKALV